MANDLAYEMYSHVVTSTQNHRLTIIEMSKNTEKKFGEPGVMAATRNRRGKRVSRAAVRIRESNGVKGERSIGASIKLRMHAVYRF